jgi:Skp family chaperone for outer membrane proteins
MEATMGRRSYQSFAKRQKEAKRLEKKKEKAERKARRREEDLGAEQQAEYTPEAPQKALDTTSEETEQTF